EPAQAARAPGVRGNASGGRSLRAAGNAADEEDLEAEDPADLAWARRGLLARVRGRAELPRGGLLRPGPGSAQADLGALLGGVEGRSEERRVGEGGRAWWVR